MKSTSSSLFLLSLPRSLSSIAAAACATSLGLRQPSWTTDAEILNWDRYSPRLQAEAPRPEKFLQMERSPTVFHRLTAFLDQVTDRRGYVYKDVTQPFVIHHWLPHPRRAGRGWPVLKLRRPIADVALAMLRRGWDYPQGAAREEAPNHDPCAALVEGLVRAHHYLGGRDP